jgi:hypothetical protein
MLMSKGQQSDRWLKGKPANLGCRSSEHTIQKRLAKYGFFFFNTKLSPTNFPYKKYIRAAFMPAGRFQNCQELQEGMRHTRKTGMWRDENKQELFTRTVLQRSGVALQRPQTQSIWHTGHCS